MNAKHTPGPWKASQGTEAEPERWTVVAENGPPWWIAVVENGQPGDTLETEAATARLIAAAPEMVEELIQCEAILSCGPGNGTLDRVRKVLTKALGPDWQNA
jgi:hypothetical protein